MHRPYSVPGGRAGIWVATCLVTFWVALGSLVAVFPGTLEELFGLDYDFVDTWGVSRGTYTTLTIGTLAVILAIALIGYAVSRGTRERAVVIPLEDDLAPAASPSG